MGNWLNPGCEFGINLDLELKAELELELCVKFVGEFGFELKFKLFDELEIDFDRFVDLFGALELECDEEVARSLFRFDRSVELLVVLELELELELQLGLHLDLGLGDELCIIKKRRTKHQD